MTVTAVTEEAPRVEELKSAVSEKLQIAESEPEHVPLNVVQSSILHAIINKPPPKIVSSAGSFLYTNSGLEIFDASGGAAVSCLGHNNSQVKDAIIRQLNDVEYVYSPFFTTEPSEQVAKGLVESTGGAMSKVFIVSSGTEAIEAGLKIARQYFTELPEPQLQRTRFIARKQSYHGNTLGALAAGGHVARRSVYEPILSQNVSHVSTCYPYRGKLPTETDEAYVSRLAQELEDEFQRVGPETVCAFLAETTPGATLGCVPPVSGYLKAMKAVCDRYGALFILDEVMSGMGRTGTMHAWEQEDVVPDLQTIAKGLGAGYAPIGALLVGNKVANVLSKGTGAFVHSQTYQGHPVACAAAHEVQQIIKKEDLLANVRKVGTYLGNVLKERMGNHKNVGEIRGRGLFWGVEFVANKDTKEQFPADYKIAATLHQVGLKEHGVSVIPCPGIADGKSGDAIIIAPAYNVSETEIDLAVGRIEKVVRQVLG